MNAERLLALYDRVADAPDAVGRLRRFVLDLAVRGKLVEQNPADEPAAELLKRIAAEKARMVRAGEIRRARNLSNGGLVRRFGVPASWEWSAIESIAHVEMGQSPRSEHYNRVGRGLAFFQGKADFGHRHPTPRYWCTKPTKTAEPGDILLSIRAPVGPTNVADQRCCIGRGLAALRPLEGLDREFMLLALRAFELDLASLGFGTTFAAITKKQLTKYGFPVPPLAEQHRIVAKVDELFALCDQLEEMRATREDRRDRLTRASLARLTAPDTDTAAFRGHARFAINALPALTTRADQVKHLRQTILSLAVRGKLVEQDPADEPASELLRRIAGERETSLRTKRAKRARGGPIALGETPFRVPSNWEWTRLGQVGDWGAGSTPSRGNTAFFGGDVTWLKSGELNDNRHLLGSEETITQLALDRCSFRMNRPGDVLIAMYGATIGKLAILAESAVTNQAVCGCTPFQGVLSHFLFLYLLSQRSTFRRSSEGGAQPNISKVKIVATPFPLPPFAEQGRIVEKVDELMALCDRLEEARVVREGTGDRLLDSLLHEALLADAATAERPTEFNWPPGGES